MAKKECNVTRKQFAANARPLAVELDGVTQVMNVKAFSTGSFGYHGTGKQNVKLADGTVVECQMNLMLTVIGSKDAVEGDDQVEATAE